MEVSAWLLADLNFSSMAALIESSRLDILFICEVTPSLMELSRLENYVSRLDILFICEVIPLLMERSRLKNFVSISFFWIRVVSFNELSKSENLDFIAF